MPLRILYLDYSPGDPKHRSKLDGIRRFASGRGWEVDAVPHGTVPASGTEALLEERAPAGCIADVSDIDVLRPPRLFGRLPLVYLDPPGRPAWIRRQFVVANDNAATARAAFQELSAGKPPAFAAVAYRMSHPWARERIEVFRSLCLASGRPFFEFVRRSGETPEARAARMAAWAASLPDRCAVFGVNDYTAGEALRALAACGRPVPATATLVGVDGAGEFPASPGSDAVSSVQIDFERAGYLAARLLARRIDAASSPSAAAPEPETVLFGPLFLLRRASTRGRARPGPVVANAVEIIRREAAAGLTARALAARMPGSRKHFERRFREAMGHSVLEEILHVRLERVKSVLVRGDVPIGVVAAACGFSSAIELKRLFRRRTGMSMREWRARHAK